MDTVFIIGAGGFGREVYSWAVQHPDCGTQWEIAGFLDDNPKALAGFGLPVGIIGGISDARPDPAARYICGLGQPSLKAEICPALSKAGARFLTLIHPSAIIGQCVHIGAGSILCPGSMLTCNIEIGRFVTINCNSSIGHDSRVGDFTTLSGFCDVTGHCTLGTRVFLGSHACIIPDTEVGSNSTVGAGSVVIRKVPANVTVFGNPAKIL